MISPHIFQHLESSGGSKASGWIQPVASLAAESLVPPKGDLLRPCGAPVEPDGLHPYLLC